MTPEEMLAEIMKRQEVHISWTEALDERVRSLSDLVGELMEWMQAPPANDLGELLKGLTTAVKGIHDEMKQLPAAVARAVTTGEV